jgi:4-azaleucine resistance transporter AzlC
MTVIHPAFWSGVRATLPILLSGFPFGMIYGLAALDAGLSPAQAQAMSIIVFAGSAQFVLTQLFAGGTHPFVMVLTIFVVNLRHLLYSASVAPHLQPLVRSWKWLLAYLLADETYVVAITRFEKERSVVVKAWFMVGVGAALWVEWQLSTAAGILLGQRLPESLPLDFVLPLTFIAIVVPLVRDRATIAAALVAGVVIALTFDAPLKLGLVIAALAGMAAGLALDRPADAGSGPASADSPRSVES